MQRNNFLDYFIVCWQFCATCIPSFIISCTLHFSECSLQQPLHGIGCHKSAHHSHKSAYTPQSNAFVTSSHIYPQEPRRSCRLPSESSNSYQIHRKDLSRGGRHRGVLECNFLGESLELGSEKAPAPAPALASAMVRCLNECRCRNLEHRGDTLCHQSHNTAAIHQHSTRS